MKDIYGERKTPAKEQFNKCYVMYGGRSYRDQHSECIWSNIITVPRGGGRGGGAGCQTNVT